MEENTTFNSFLYEIELILGDNPHITRARTCLELEDNQKDV